jgi:hypothetical protein
MCGIHREQAKVPALATAFHVDAAGERPGFLDEQELSLLQQCAHFFWVGAVAIGEEMFSASSGLAVRVFMGWSRAGEDARG